MVLLMIQELLYQYKKDTYYFVINPDQIHLK